LRIEGGGSRDCRPKIEVKLEGRLQGVKGKKGAEMTQVNSSITSIAKASARGGGGAEEKGPGRIKLGPTPS